ncbi:four helix bundle protein [Ereboglobus sp. PH5-10]|uniref:Four helix bundle protein n=1 Tax=Ereboglobus luteus TaxID=1796921 RepID=A0A2U8E1T0_9BACT|nr:MULTISPECIES: four helix bundle protein [Ereboglobus]AWI08839.1 four helix bundle protein [Ereboglobus luteus]MDF9827442.1 four helix bundle protein [Ereboglobus sp. PH5-10]
MSENLEERTEKFAVAVRTFVRALPRTVSNIEDVKQLVRASGSVAANYIEANESLGGRDKLLHFKICRKEAKESGLWLRLVHVGDNNAPLENQRQILRQEARELTLIFAAILRNME